MMPGIRPLSKQLYCCSADRLMLHADKQKPTFHRDVAKYENTLAGKVGLRSICDHLKPETPFPSG